MTPEIDDIVGSGPPFGQLERVAVAANGALLVVDHPHLSLSARVIRVDRATGDRSSSRWTEPARQWTKPLIDPVAISVDNRGHFVVGDRQFEIGALFRINSETGDRTVISGCPQVTLDLAFNGQCMAALIGRGAKTTRSLSAVAVRPDRSLVALGRDRVLQIDPVTGDRTLISGCAESDQLGNCSGDLKGGGPRFRAPSAIAVRDPHLLVVDSEIVERLFRSTLRRATGKWCRVATM